MSHKPWIYILPQESANPNKIVSTESSDKGYLDAVLDTAYSLKQIGFDSVAVGLTIWGVKRLKESLENRSQSQQYRTADDELKSFFEKINLDLNDWLELIEKIPFVNIPPEISFPPGHPMPRRLYRVHPLKTKEKQYIPFEVYDSLLYQEREAELIKLLVNLGAIEITIEELSKNQTERKGEAKASLANAGGIEAEVKGESQKSNVESKNITLKQKKWDIADFNEGEYSWLPYEPEWETLVYARKQGGCLSFEIELNSDTSYSVSAGIGIEGIIKQIAEVGGEINFSRSGQERKLFKVKFVDN